MKNEIKKVRIFVMLKYAFVFGVVMTLLFIVVTTLPFLPIQIFPPASKVLNCIWLIVGNFFIVLGIITIVVTYQTAILDDTGIILKISVWKVAEIKWGDIVKIDVKSLVTLQSTMKSFNKKWIIIYTGLNQEAKVGGGNAKNRPPWQIIYSNRNARILNSFLKKYTRFRIIIA